METALNERSSKRAQGGEKASAIMMWITFHAYGVIIFYLIGGGGGGGEVGENSRMTIKGGNRDFLIGIRGNIDFLTKKFDSNKVIDVVMFILNSESNGQIVGNRNIL